MPFKISLADVPESLGQGSPVSFSLLPFTLAKTGEKEKEKKKDRSTRVSPVSFFFFFFQYSPIDGNRMSLSIARKTNIRVHSSSQQGEFRIAGKGWRLAPDRL